MVRLNQREVRQKAQAKRSSRKLPRKSKRSKVKIKRKMDNQLIKKQLRKTDKFKLRLRQ